MNSQNISSLPPYLNKFMKANFDKLIVKFKIVIKMLFSNSTTEAAANA